MLRWMVNNYLIKNKDIKFRDFDMKECVLLDASSLQEYQEKYILEDRQDARTLVIVLTPVVLGINLEIVIFDHETMKISTTLKYGAKIKKSDIPKRTYLNMSDQTITVILKHVHYDLLYEKKLIHKYPILQKYDTGLLEKARKLAKSGVCKICDEYICNKCHSYTLNCGHIYHTICLMKHIEKCNFFIISIATKNLVLLTKKESKDYTDPSCYYCKYIIPETDYARIFGEGVYNHYNELRNYRNSRELEEKIIKKGNFILDDYSDELSLSDKSINKNVLEEFKSSKIINNNSHKENIMNNEYRYANCNYSDEISQNENCNSDKTPRNI